MAGFSDINASVNEAIESSQSDNDSESRNGRANQQDDSQQESDRESQTQEEKEIAELEKIEKFMFQGKEYTPKELGTLLARQKEQDKAFTQKSQQLAEERRNWESQRSANSKYEDNLVYDLEKVRQNPNLAQEFIKTYPESYHRHLRAVLSSNSSSQEQSTGRASTNIPVELMSEVQQLRSYVHEQEVAKTEASIERDLTKALGDFKHASRKEVLADVWEFHNSLQSDPVTGKKPPVPYEIWAKAAEASHNDRVEWGKGYQRDLQQQQKQANQKARDVGSGGGTPSSGPKKFDPKKGFAQLNRDVLAQMTKS